MKQIQTLLLKLSPEIQEKISQNMGITYEEQQRRDCERFNAIPGKRTGYDCPECLNRGGNYVLRGSELVFRECQCLEIRQNLKRIENSGLGDMLRTSTFENFTVEEDWQRELRQSAQAFITAPPGSWFFVGGAVGAGKTHICTAIVGEFLRQGRSARYMLWRDEVVQIKASVTDDLAYSRLVNPLKTVDVLYIDDFFKTAKGKAPTDGDIHVAFEIINYRYNNKKLVTILSSEHFADSLTEMDEAVGSRIYQRTKGYCSNIKRDKQRNYRMRDA